jgi:hypothetical protein
MPSIKKLFGPRLLLEAEQLEFGKVYPYRIVAVRLVEVCDAPKLEIEFYRSIARLLAGKELAEAVASILELDDSDLWVGREIGLYRSVNHFDYRSEPCIRVCAPPRRSTTAKTPSS